MVKRRTRTGKKRRTRQSTVRWSKNVAALNYTSGGAYRGTTLNTAAKHFKRTCMLPSANVATSTGGGNGQAISISDDAWVLNTGGGGITSSTYYGMSMYFTLDMFPDYTDFTNLFDQYKLRKIKVRLIPYSTNTILQSGQAAGVINQNLAVLTHQIIDYDDASALTASGAGVNIIREFDTYKTKNLFGGGRSTVNRYFTPHIAEAAYAAGVFTSFSNKKPSWIDCNSPSVQHYGLKTLFHVFSPDTIASSFVWFAVEITGYFTFKNTR